MQKISKFSQFYFKLFQAKIVSQIKAAEKSSEQRLVDYVKMEQLTYTQDVFFTGKLGQYARTQSIVLVTRALAVMITILSYPITYLAI